MKCAACGFSNPGGFQFCGHCGQRLAERLPEAERRQLTVMFFDLVGSTTLSAHLDPEELRDLVQTYQQVCNEVVSRYQGHVAQYLGDGILVYFGFPRAHPDDGVRAVSSALAILQAMAALNERLSAQSRPRLDLRVGIHTGLVVVGEMGSKEHREHLALGETPNVAARLQGLAGVNQVVFGQATYELVQDEFVVESLGMHSLKGVPEPVPVYRAVTWAGADERQRTRRLRRSALPLLGREPELERLREIWRHCCQGQGSVCEVVGEAGVGKSRLLQELKDELKSAPVFLLSCFPQPEKASVPWSGVAALLQRELEFSPPELSPLDKLLHLLRWKAPDLQPQQCVPLLSPLLQMDTSEFFPPPALSPSSQRAKTMETLDRLFLAMARIKPCLLIVDGYEWMDPSSREWLGALAPKAARARLLVLLTSRQPRLDSVSRLELDRLAEEPARKLVQYRLDELNRTGGHFFELTPENLNQLLERADGIPFYLDELTRTAYARRNFEGLPGRLHDFLMARLDDLGSSKLTAQQASIIGRGFSRRLVAALAGGAVDNQVRRLLEEGIVAAPKAGGELAFVQNLMREACYDSLLRSVRQRYHGQVAQLFTTEFAVWATQNPAVVAHHYLHSNQPSEAIPWLLQAVLRSLACCALSEAVTACQKALEQLDALPLDHPHQALRLKFLTLQGSAWIGLRGYAAPEVERCYQQARELCAALGDSLPVFPVLAGLWALYLVQGKLSLAETISARLLDLAREGTYRRVACAVRGQTRFFQGFLHEAVLLLEEAVAHYRPEEARGETLAFLLTEPSIASASYLSYARLLQGRHQEARLLSQQAWRWAEQLDHPHTMAHTLSFEAWLLVSLEEPEAALRRARQLEDLSGRQSFPLWAAMAKMFAGAAGLALGDPGGAQELQVGLQAGQRTGAQLGATWMLANLAQATAAAGDLETALGLIEQALALGESLGELWYLPEMLRLKAEWRNDASLLEEARRLAEQQGAVWFLKRLTSSPQR